MNRPSIEVWDKHPALIRICHWLNVPLLFMMVWSGILIYWADQAFLRIPDELIETLNIHHRLAEGMGWHFFTMWPFVINGVIYFSYLIFTGKWKDRFPDRAAWTDFHHVILHDLKIKKNPPVTRGIYNSVQRFLYPMAFVMGIGSVLSGFAIYKPVQLGLLVELFGGYRMARKLHFYLMYGLMVFFFFHLIQVSRSGWNNLRGMIAGYELRRKLD